MPVVERPLLNYYGGKWTSAPWIISHFPEHKIYVDVFGGAASVLLRKPRSHMEIVNDIDAEIVNVYHMLRDRGDELRRHLALTPYSRAEFYDCIEKTNSDLENARRTIVRSFFGIGDSISNNTGFRNSKSSNTSPASQWHNWLPALDQIIDRFRGVMIEQNSWEAMLEKYDTTETLFYLDPPYVGSTRDGKHGYTYELDDAGHRSLLATIQKLKGHAVLSGYNCDLYDGLKWKRAAKQFKTQGDTSRHEMLWLCPKTVASEKQMELGSGAI